MAWLTGWSYAKEISLTGQTGAGTLYQVELDIGDSAGGDFHLEGHCTNFPQDIEVTDDDGTTLLDFWIEDTTADPLKMWVEVADDLGSNQKIWVYYGKSGATTNSDIGDTFLFGDDFSDGDYTSDPVWTVRNGAWSATNYYLETLAQGDRITTPNTNAYGAWEFKHQFTDGNKINSDCTIFGLMGDTTSPMLNNGNGYFSYLSHSENRVDLYKVTSGSPTKIISGSFTHDTSWHTYKITRDSNGDFEIFVDNISKGTVTDNTHTTSTYINLEHYRKTQGSKRFDGILIRKYNDPEPAFSIAGAEQSAPSVGNPYWYYNLLKRRNS